MINSMTSPTIIQVINDELLVIRLSGSVTRQTLHDLAKELNRVGAGTTYTKQLVYVADNTTADVKSDDVLFYRSQRPERHTQSKAAFCAFNELQYGMARMFQSVLESEYLDIEIFRDIESAAQWLDVDGTLLKKTLP
jgi:hypothetical protein